MEVEQEEVEMGVEGWGGEAWEVAGLVGEVMEAAALEEVAAAEAELAMEATAMEAAVAEADGRRT